MGDASPVNEPVNDPESVVVIGPSLVRTSDAVENAFREADVTARFVWYHERNFERGWVTTQLARVAMLAASRLGTSARAEQLRLVAHRVRFDQTRAGRDISAMVEQQRSSWNFGSGGAVPGSGPTVVLIKPAMLSISALQALLASLTPDRVVAYLWDPLWRTPAVNDALSLCGRVYTTEARDAGDAATLLALPPAPVVRPPDIQSPGAYAPAPQTTPTVFFCGTFTPRRLLRALIVVVGAKSAKVRPDITLVAKSRVLRKLMNLVGIHTEPKDPSEYERSARASRMLLDLGQKGQDSPSDRLNDAKVFGRPLISQNATIRDRDAVVSVERWIPSELASALRTATSRDMSSQPLVPSEAGKPPAPDDAAVAAEARRWALTILSA